MGDKFTGSDDSSRHATMPIFGLATKVLSRVNYPEVRPLLPPKIDP
jgi:hypothetical protein